MSSDHKLTILKDVAVLETKKLLIDYPYELDNFQKHAVNVIERNEHCIVSVPTGSGKSMVAEYAIARTIKNGKKVIYTSPIKALSNEKYKSFRELFGKEFQEKTGIEVSVGLLTGDTKLNPNGNCLIMTAEILANALYKLKGIKKDVSHFDLASDFTSDIGCVILDEVHYINSDRGKVWESILVLLNNDVQLIMLSATISKPEDFGQWLANIKEKPMNLIIATKRNVPLRYYIYCDLDSQPKNRLHMIMDKDGVYDSVTYNKIVKEYDSIKIQREKKHKNLLNVNLIPDCVEYLKTKGLLRAIFFSFSRANCEKYANMISKSLIDSTERAEIDRIFSHHMHKYEKQYETLPQYINIKKVLEKGVAYHHSGLIPILKEIIEIIFQKGLIKVLFATESYAVGINASVKTVVFTELEKHTGKGKRYIDTAEAKQLSGRAGRRGLDTYGLCILLPLYDLPSDKELSNILKGRVPHIQSKFTIDYQFLLKAIQSESTNITNFMNKSLYYKEHIDIKNNIVIDINKLSKVINNTKIDATDEQIKLFKSLYEIENIGLSETNFKMMLSKQQLKNLEKLKKDVLSINKMSEYKQYTDLIKNQSKLVQLEKQLDYYNKYISMSCDTIIQFLKEIGYLINNDSTTNTISHTDVSQKGVIAAQINDCNAILLTEMIMNDVFTDLLPEEIVAVLSVFIDDAKDHEELSIEDIDGTDAIYNKLTKLNTIINKLQALEAKYNIDNNYEYWKISFNYVDISYGWAIGMNIHELKQYFTTMYEGNFVKNILKINNIVHTLQCLVLLCNKIELLPSLEKIEALLIRNIVNVNSLYLT